MFSKLRYFEDCLDPASRQLRNKKALDSVQNCLLSSYPEISITPIEKGTLNGCLKLTIEEKDFFLKIPENETSSLANLEKEKSILSCIYDEYLTKNTFCDILSKKLPNFLCSQVLTHSDNLSPEQVLKLINNYQSKLSEFKKQQLITNNYDISNLLHICNRALVTLNSQNLINNQVRSDCCKRISELSSLLASTNRTICHGDLGPENIMNLGAEKIAIDWEDAFWGIEGYDYLYWMTFFCNRKYLSKENLGKTPWPIDIEIAIMLMIVVLKSYLSYTRNNYQNNALSFNDRLQEILILTNNDSANR